MAREKNEKTKMNPVLWFLFAIIIPIIVAISLALVIFSVAGFDVSGWLKKTGNQIPVVSSFITNEEEQKMQIEVDKLKEVLEKKDKEMNQLLDESERLKGTIAQLEKEIAKLEKTNETLGENRKKLEEETTDSIKEFVGSFKDMDHKQAAKIMEQMKQETAVSILKEMPNKVRGGVLEAMDPKIAAKLTQLLLEDK